MSEREEEHNPTENTGPGIDRQQARLISAHARVMSGLAGLDVSHEDVMRIKRTLSPYLRPVAKYLEVTKRKKRL